MDQQRDTRETVDSEYHYLIFDMLADSYNEQRITYAAMVQHYFKTTGIAPKEQQ